MVDIAKEVQTLNGSISINGSYDPRFEAVYKQFEDNFTQRGEVGAGVSVTLQGVTVVDLWGGVADAESRKPWTDKTMPIVWSSTKGAFGSNSTRSAGAPTDSRPAGSPSRSAGLSDSARHSRAIGTPP